MEKASTADRWNQKCVEIKCEREKNHNNNEELWKMYNFLWVPMNSVTFWMLPALTQKMGRLCKIDCAEETRRRQWSRMHKLNIMLCFFRYSSFTFAYAAISSMFLHQSPPFRDHFPLPTIFHWLRKFKSFIIVSMHILAAADGHHTFINIKKFYDRRRFFNS